MNEWMGRSTAASAKPVTDWVEDVEKGDAPEKFDPEAGGADHREMDRPSRPTSRDSRVSRDSQGSKQSKGSRNSGDKAARKLNDYAIEPLREQQRAAPHPLIHDFDMDKKPAAAPAVVRKPQAPAPQQHQLAPADLRGYFRDAPVEEKKMARTAPGPITREKLEAAEAKELTGMTQLRKRDTKVETKLPVQQQQLEEAGANKLAPLLDSDLLENISEDEDTLLEGGER
jgi:hypothetical protein